MPGPQIVVIGLGAMGSATLYQLARRGVRAIGIEQFDLGHDRGSSHGPTRVIRLAHYENAAYLPLMCRAYELWHELEGMVDKKLIATTGIIQIGSANSEVVKDTIEAARKYDLDLPILNAGSIMRDYPVFRLPEHFKAIWQPDGGYIEAATALDATIRAAQDAGATVRTGEKVIAIEPRQNTVRISTDRDQVEADGLVVTAGPWMAKVLRHLKLPLRVTRQVVGWFEPDDVGEFAADRFPVFVLESHHGHHYGLPYYQDMGVKIAMHHHFNEAVDPDCYGMTISAADEKAIRAPFAEFLPSLEGRPLRSAQTCLYTMTPDNTFIIDRLPGSPQVVIASPCCGHGFKFSPVVGEIAADLVTAGTTRHDIAAFRLGRFNA
jgi:sarcosine oxidase